MEARSQKDSKRRTLGTGGPLLSAIGLGCIVQAMRAVNR
jgi:hypothetical protein